MNQEFIPYKQALELKQLGFDEPCFGSYQLIENRDYGNGLDISFEIGLNTLNGIRNHNYKDEITNAPLYQQAFRWLREKYNFYSYIGIRLVNYEYYLYSYNIIDYPFRNEFATYEEAELECLNKLIEIVKTK